MSGYPKDGSTFVLESIARTAYRWAKYKPDGARQMGKPGRWQKQVWSGNYFKWENCEEPVGEIAPATEDGPISGAVKALAAKNAEIECLKGALARVAALAAYYDGIPPRKYFGDTDCELRYSDAHKAAVPVKLFRDARAALEGGAGPHAAAKEYLASKPCHEPSQIDIDDDLNSGGFV